jgi:cytochrome c-type biogenesis protein
MGMNIGLVLLAFIAGLLSCFSPCVLPLMPGYIGYLSGAAVTSQGIMVERRAALMHALAFVLGFTAIFVAIWSAFFAVTQFVDKFLLARIAGAILIAFGLHLTGLLRIPLLYREARVQVNVHGLGLPRSFLTGIAFGAGWTPCVGPMLSFILTLAMQTTTALQGTGLLLFYSAGLGVPFLLAAFGLEAFQRRMRGASRYLHYFEIAGGVLLIGMGLLLLFDKFQILNAFFYRLTPPALFDLERTVQQWLGVKLDN